MIRLRTLAFSSYLLLLVIFIGSVQYSSAQIYFSNPFRGTFFQPQFGAAFGSFFNLDDYLLDINAGMDELGYDFSAMIGFSFRPYWKRVRFKAGNHLFYQSEEKIYQISLDLEKRFYFLQYGGGDRKGKVGFYLMGKFGYLWGKYGGFKKARNQNFAINPGAGLSWQFNKIARLSLGYLYFSQTPYVKPHTLLIRLNFYTGQSRDNN